MTTVEVPAQGRPRHRRPLPRLLRLLHWLLVAVAVFAVWAYLIGPVLVDSYGLGATWFVVVLLSAVILLWRR